MARPHAVTIPATDRGVATCSSCPWTRTWSRTPVRERVVIEAAKHVGAGRTSVLVTPGGSR